MMPDRELFDAITNTALAGCDVNVSARKNAIWNACLAMMADVLREADPFTAERLLRGVEDELRKSIVELDQLLKPTPPRNPFKMN